MKLIIDIPEETYNDIQSRDWKNGEFIFSEEWKAIHNGIPLDKIRAEIKENIKDLLIADWETNNILADGLQMALNIIDRYREGE